MSEHTPSSETQSLRPGSDPREIARKARERIDAEHPTQIGPYRILQPLGEGGMGTVYLAEQTKPIHRRVALKIIKLGMDTKSVIARFEAEREALALMNHPNVAKVFDAGATETGRPYFVMEYVAGTPITDYCDAHRLTTDERLHLLIDVCHAVQHAHQKGIIPRDIKPSNVLVTQVDDKASVKVIDFGIAKATQQRLAEATYFTEHGQVIGTPAYMSPEQAGGSGQTDVDTRADVYSLGVLLYEMLVGALPFESDELRRAAFTEFIRTITEVDPLKPSARLAAMGLTSTTIADSRGTSSRTLLREIRGDLDWIVMKCLEKDRTRRYDTVNALALEIGRYLNNEPVLAGPPSASYRVRKFIRRNKGSVLAAAIIVLVLIAGLTGTTFGLVQAQRERARAEQARDDESAERKIAEGEKVKAVAARDEAEAVTQFLSDTLASANPEKQGKDVTVREVLDKAAERIGEEFEDKPRVEARLQRTIGWTYYSLGLYQSAQAHTAEAAAIYRRTNGETDPSTITAVGNLASIIGARGEYNKSEATLRATLERNRRVWGEEDLRTLGLMNNLAASLYTQNRSAEAEALHRETLQTQRRVLGDEHPDTLLSMQNLANSICDQGRYAEGEALERQTLDIQRRVRGTEHPETLSTMQGLAATLNDQGHYAEAETMIRQTLEIRRRVLGGEHPDTLMSMENLANSINHQGRYAEAEALCRQTVEIKRRVLGEEHPNTLLTMDNLAAICDGLGSYAEAEALQRRTLEVRRRLLGEENPSTLHSMHNLAATFDNQGRYTESEALNRQTLEIRRPVLGEEHPDTLSTMQNVALALQNQGRYVEAEGLNRQTLEIKRRVLGEEHPLTLASMGYLAGILEEQGRHAESEKLYRSTLEAQRRILGEEHPKTLQSMSNLATVLDNQGRYAEAEKLFRKTLEVRRRLFGNEDPKTLLSITGLAQTLALDKRPEEARPRFLELITSQRRAAEEQPSNPKALIALADVLLTCEVGELRDAAAALPLAEKAVEATGGRDQQSLATLALAYHETGAIDLSRNAE